MAVARPRQVALANDLAAVFADELAAQLEAAARLLPLLAAPVPPADGCRDLARIFHTIKGGAGLVGRTDLAGAAEALERFFADPGTAAAPGQAALDALYAAAALPAPSLASALPASPAPRSVREQVVLVQAGTAVLAVPLQSIARAAVVSMRDVTYGPGGASLLLRGATLDAVLLASLVGQPPPQRRAVALSLAMSRSIVVLADRIGTPGEIARLPVPRLLAAHPFLAGVAIDSSGAAVCVLDAARLAAGGCAPTGAAVPGPVPTGKVLVVDDSLVVRGAIADLLDSAGIPFETAVDGCDALGKLAGAPAAAVVTDVEMPHMDGLALIETLRADVRWRSLPVLLCTSRAHGLEPERLRALGVAGVVAKPFDGQTLLTQVRRLLAGHGSDGLL